MKVPVIVNIYIAQIPYECGQMRVRNKNETNIKYLIKNPKWQKADQLAINKRWWSGDPDY